MGYFTVITCRSCDKDKIWQCYLKDWRRALILATGPMIRKGGVGMCVHTEENNDSEVSMKSS